MDKDDISAAGYLGILNKRTTKGEQIPRQKAGKRNAGYSILQQFQGPTFISIRDPGQAFFAIDPELSPHRPFSDRVTNIHQSHKKYAYCLSFYFLTATIVVYPSNRAAQKLVA